MLGQLTQTVQELENKVNLLAASNEELSAKIDTLMSPEWVAKSMNEWAHKAVGKSVMENSFRLLMLLTVATAVIWREQFFEWWTKLWA